jgi:hypothetical protein
MRLLKARQIAYYRDKSYTAWINGARIFEANSKVSINANRTKKSDKVEQYSDWKDPFENKLNKITQEESEIEFRKYQAEQNAWLHNMLHNK